MRTSDERFAIQDLQYRFPYHYLPHRVGEGSFASGRHLSWGLEYLVYQEFIAGIIRQLSPRSVLEVGCGDGRLIGSLTNAVPVRVGVDLSRRSIDFARAFHPDVTFLCTNVDEVADVFDIVVAVEVLEHIPDEAVQPFLSSLRRRARPGGRIIISVPTTVVPLHPKHYRHYTLAELNAQLQAAGVPTNKMTSHFVYGEDWLLKAHRRMMFNRLWSLEVPALNWLLWRYVQRRRAVVDSRSGRHLVVCIVV